MWEVGDGRDLTDFRAVHVLAFPRPTAALLNAIGHYLSVHEIPAVNLGVVAAPTKLHKYVRLACSSIMTPRTDYLPPRLLRSAYERLVNEFEVPFVIKSVAGGSGRVTSVVSDETTFGRLRDTEQRVLVQELVPTERSYQVLVLGGSVEHEWQAVDVGPEMLPRPRWGNAEPVKPETAPAALCDVAVRSAAALGYDLALVHAVQHWTSGEWMVLDVSATPLASNGMHREGIAAAYGFYLRSAPTPTTGGSAAYDVFETRARDGEMPAS